jgi:hypothetical protein
MVKYGLWRVYMPWRKTLHLSCTIPAPHAFTQCFGGVMKRDDDLNTEHSDPLVSYRKLLGPISDGTEPPDPAWPLVSYISSDWLGFIST